MVKETKGATRSQMLEWTHSMVLILGITGGMATWQILEAMHYVDGVYRLIFLIPIFFVIPFMFFVFDFVIEGANQWEVRKGKKSREKIFCSGDENED